MYVVSSSHLSLCYILLQLSNEDKSVQSIQLVALLIVCLAYNSVCNRYNQFAHLIACLALYNKIKWGDLVMNIARSNIGRKGDTLT